MSTQACKPNVRPRAAELACIIIGLWGQEPAMLRLAQQVTALLSCLKELFAEYSIPASLAQNERAGLYWDGIPIALHDTHRYTSVHSLSWNIITDC